LNKDDDNVKENIDNAKFTLSKCIKEYIPSSSIKIFSTLSSRLANDEIHYTKIHNQDIQFLKNTIDGLIHQIALELSTEKAEKYVSQRK
jgi:hypothetical protein